MRSFSCARCGQLLFFENTQCLRCGARLGFDPVERDLVVREFRPELEPCANAELAHCNWLLEPGDGPLCRSCRLTRTRPADEDAEGLEQFAVAETAKRRLLFELLELGLPIDGGLRFDLLSSRDGPVTTGHADGLITLDLAETDDVRRAQRQAELAEPYRTLLGHFRHEVGHYYESLLVDEGGAREAFRTLFGDERSSYSDALERHYAEGPPPDWNERFVSAYATMHPWEDWAETFAHYLHITDALQTAAAFGIVVAGPEPELSAVPPTEVAAKPFSAVLDEWLPLTYALNAVNRSMGGPDLYPFTLAPPVIDKLSFAHDLVTRVTPGLA